MPRHRILIVEDDPSIAAGLRDALESEGYETATAESVGAAERELIEGIDLVVLDLGLPDEDGARWLTRLRRDLPQLPVVVSSARDGLSDRIEALETGADDYLVKPYAVEEFLARIRAVLRRSPERPRPVASFVLGTLEIDLERRELRAGGAPTGLTELEAGLLGHLHAHRGRAVAREELLARVWGIDARLVRTRTVDMHVARLREKLRAAGGGDPIRTVRGRGYVLEEEPAGA